MVDIKAGTIKLSLALKKVFLGDLKTIEVMGELKKLGEQDKKDFVAMLNADPQPELMGATVEL